MSDASVSPHHKTILKFRSESGVKTNGDTRRQEPRTVLSTGPILTRDGSPKTPTKENGSYLKGNGDYLKTLRHYRQGD